MNDFYLLLGGLVSLGIVFAYYIARLRSRLEETRCEVFHLRLDVDRLKEKYSHLLEEVAELKLKQ